VLAPNSPLREVATADGRDAAGDPSASAEVAALPAASAANTRSPARCLWVMLPLSEQARLFESLPLTCPNGGADMRIIAFITEAVPVERILSDIGELSRPLPSAPARGPPAWEYAPEPVPDSDFREQPEPDFAFDQRVAR
jgi:hypothetical protein